ncbi:MAG: hypothetical protein HYS04_19850 [Acidobacteria bacterium]|nr:hypothetical protein [Acidobacteriota bacterium]
MSPRYTQSDRRSKQGRTTMTRSKYLLAVMAAVSTAAALANVRLEFPGPLSQGPPYYAQISDLPGIGLQAIHTDEWAAIPFFRELACVPGDFNLLDIRAAAPAAFACTLTVQGFEIRKSLAPEDVIPIQGRLSGLGAVAILFVSWPQLQAAAADGNLTLAELKALPSYQVSYASFFTMTHHPWAPGDDLRGAVIEISARGLLQDGRQFQLQVSGVHVPKDWKHVTIRFW